MTRFRQWCRDTFTLHRWALNPFQMYDITFLLAAAIAQIQLGASPTSVQADLDRQTLLALAVANVFGATIALYGLHLKDLEGALWVEFCGYVILVFVLGVYVWLVIQSVINPSASYGYALAEAFVWAALHRSVQILLYKRAKRKKDKLSVEAKMLRDTLSNIMPSHPVLGEEDMR